jgi:hypothetical protein
MFNIRGHKGNASQTTLRFHLTLVKMLSSITQTATKNTVRLLGGREEHFYMVNGNVN